MEKGDIIHGLNNLDGKHRIIFLENHDEYSFVGAMVTHSPNFPENVPMESEHFEKTDAEGNEYTFKPENTYLVGRKLLKRQEWAPFMKLGKLTPQGVEFIDKILSGTTPVFWEEHRIW